MMEYLVLLKKYTTSTYYIQIVQIGCAMFTIFNASTGLQSLSRLEWIQFFHWDWVALDKLRVR